jgi:hypothetical protein
MTKADSNLKAAVSAILKREQSERSESQTSPDPRFAALSRNLGEKLEPIYSAAGLDIKKIRELQKEHRAAFEQLLERSKPKIDKFFALHLRERTSNKKRALELAGGKPLTITQIVLDQPTFIFVTPAGMFVDEHIESWNNFAKVLLGVQDVDGHASLKFFFGWRNPSSEFSAVINAKGEIVAHGFWEIAAFTGVIFGGEAALRIGSELKVHAAGHIVGLDMDVLLSERSVKAYGGLYGSDNQRKEGTINAINNLACNNIIVGPDEQVIFEVAMNISYEMVKDAGVNVDFSSGDFQVTSAALIVELLTAPMVTADLGSVSPINVQS